MHLKAFLKLVEIQTKVASALPLWAGGAFAWHRYGEARAWTFLTFWISLLCIDMATTAINNLMDYRKAVRKEGYNYQEHNAMAAYGLEERTAEGAIAVLLGTGAIFGILLSLQTDLLVLVLGILAFGVGILYSWGPVPISRTPLGEVFSGLFMGFLIFFLSAYVQLESPGWVELDLEAGRVLLALAWVEPVVLLLVSLPLVFGIANIMLANNICDMEDDRANGRTTLPMCLGKPNALALFKGLYVLAYLSPVLLAATGILPWTGFLAPVAYLPVHRMVQGFVRNPDKKETFVLSVKSFLWTGLFHVLVSLSGLVL
ncbi:1,4-dihydroxy-2-naphthoate polyprenyltransferase [Anaerotalea alkaliphila]|uniref:1,4-dihydroxy-2-naphthoate polyprenyltransferase n=1 Tax=Anaerotalea alkaliphila TaxID=2662126 RepID=A0A7X5KM43_9FIRM|nr:1,4-dihydroxy-2-naphthoate polyprenyltransferase [Anaerotalea alkaliphila]NDL66569.1 1,4-dihydroxy-2-naphthoate polyprenyltransferase [Anaerotalea alkaliphila]